MAIVSEKREIQSKNESVKYQLKTTDIIRYMNASNIVHMKDKIIYYTSFERPKFALQKFALIKFTGRRYVEQIEKYWPSYQKNVIYKVKIKV